MIGCQLARPMATTLATGRAPRRCSNFARRSPVPSLTVENYIKAIFQICANGDGQAATGQLAQALDVSPGTVTSMLKTLSEGNLVTYTPYEGVRLTGAGNALALRVVRRHRLIELFLVKTLDLSWDEVHEEAEHMEHAVSDRLIDKIDEFLGHPDVDPHGDPIPRSDGTFETPASRTLAECRVGDHFRLARVLDQSPDFLRFLSNSGLSLGVAGQIVANSAQAGIVSVRVDGQETTLGRAAAEKILVTSPKPTVTKR
jgi:DtxR family Mn-dependent transcriptional regulator